MLFNAALCPQKPPGCVIQCCFMSTETTRLCYSMLLYVHRNHQAVLFNAALCPQKPPGCVIQCCFMSTETTRLCYSMLLYVHRNHQAVLFNVALRPQISYGPSVRDGEPRTATSTFIQLLNSALQCCFPSTETVRTIRDGSP